MNEGSATDDLMCRAIELLLQIRNRERDGEKVDCVTSPSYPSAKVKTERLFECSEDKQRRG